MSHSKFTFAFIAALFGLGINALAQKPTPLLTTTSADKLIAVLKSDAPQKEKVDACRQLAVIGNKDAVPALAALLPDEKLSHMARFALEAIPDASVDKVLRESLKTLKGRPLVGVIGSIGTRKDAAATPELTQLLQNTDADVAQAAARALGKIGTWDAAKAIQRVVEDVPASNQVAFCEGLLHCAETLTAKGDRKQAMSIYDKLQETRTPQQVQVAALRGTVLVRGGAGSSLLAKALRNKDDVLFNAAIRTSYELADAQVTKVLASSLSELSSDDRKILVIQALAKRTDPAALPALTASVKSGALPVRLAAIRALGESGNAAAAPVLSELLTASEKELSDAALNSFSGLQGKEVETLVESMLNDPNAARRVAGIELIGRRRMAASLPALFKAASGPDAQVRPAALSQLGELGQPSDLPALLDVLPKLKTSQDLDAAEQALSTVCAKADRPESHADTITERLHQAEPGQKAALLRVLSSVGGPVALKTVRAGVNDPNPEVHGAALRALGAWKSAEAAPDLLALAKSASNPTDQTLCLRSYLGLASNPDVPADQRLAMCRSAVDLTKSAEEQKLLLGTLGSIDSAEAVDMALPYLEQAATKEEAGAAVVAIAEKMLKNRNHPGTPKLVQPLEKVVQANINDDLTKRARTLLQQAQRRSSNS